jgi:hypothetical protein
LKRLNAGKMTVRGFGRRWLRNALRNLDLVQRHARPCRSNAPYIVCASGPSLERDLPELAAWKASPSPPVLVAVSSSVPCLLSAGVIPDIVITTDGGSWALFHLAEAFRLLRSKKEFSQAADPLFITALNAALPSQIETAAVLFLADESVWQRYLLRSFGLPFLTFPQRGTVSASALDAAFFLTSGPVYVSGIDFHHNDLVTHSRPYVFDRLREESAFRLNPAYSQAFRREEMIRSGGALSVYDSWFKKELPKYPKRLYAFSEENALSVPPGLPFPKPALKTNVVGCEPEEQVVSSGPAEEPPGTRGIACLESGVCGIAAGTTLAQELGEMLGMPAKGAGQTAGIINELRALRKPVRKTHE